MYLNNFSKFSEVDDRYASFNTSKNNVKENFTNNWQSTGWFKNSGSYAERCNDGKYHNGYHYKYNEGRYLGYNLCGNSWCCKKQEDLGWKTTGWFKNSGSYAERCNDGKYHNGYLYKYNEGRNLGYNLCGNSWCCKKKVRITTEEVNNVINNYKIQVKNNSNSCNGCTNLMAALEPMIYILYKLILEESPKGIAVGLLISLATGVATAGIEDDLINLIESNKGIKNALDGLSPSGNSKDNIFINLLVGAVTRTAVCLGTSIMANVKKLGAEGKNIGKEIVHAFVRCLITEIIRAVVMLQTGCTDRDKCRPKKAYLDFIENKIIDPIKTKLKESGFTDNVKTIVENDNSKDTGNVVSDSTRGKNDFISNTITFLADLFSR